MSVLLTGAAGFIGFHVCQALLDRGERMIGVDNLNTYYDPELKQARVDQLLERKDFSFHKADLADREPVFAILDGNPDIDRVVHLAAQAGVRYSLENPYAYIDANVTGHLVVLEACRRLPGFQHLVYASSSSVYGGNTKLPFSVADRTDTPVSLYAATKRAGELLSQCYTHLYELPMTGLRFFTVYGPWGRPDMAYFKFTKAIFEDRPIQVFNQGEMRRDFTYIDDIVAGVLSALDQPPSAQGGVDRHRIYNLGNHKAENLLHFIEVLETACGREAAKIFEDMQLGDVKETYADISGAQRDLGFAPRIGIAEGLPRFVSWYRNYYRV